MGKRIYFSVWEKVQINTVTREISLKTTKTLNMELSCDKAVALLNIYPKPTIS